MSKNFILKKYDLVTYISRLGRENQYTVGENYNNTPISYFEKDNSKVLRVERPIKYEIVWEKKEILDKIEKEYISAVIKPFRSKIKFITKYESEIRNVEFIFIELYDDELALPYFKGNTMYKGMELGKQYTLQELGL